MNVYTYGNFTFVNNYAKSTLYKDGKILFMGNSWSGIQTFLKATNNAPEVRAMFRQQLEQREKPKYTNSEAQAKK